MISSSLSPSPSVGCLIIRIMFLISRSSFLFSECPFSLLCSTLFPCHGQNTSLSLSNHRFLNFCSIPRMCVFPRWHFNLFWFSFRLEIFLNYLVILQCPFMYMNLRLWEADWELCVWGGAGFLGVELQAVWPDLAAPGPDSGMSMPSPETVSCPRSEFSGPLPGGGEPGCRRSGAGMGGSGCASPFRL